MLNARCYFHFSPVVVNTVVCCFADCYSYCRYKDVLSNKAINQPSHGKAQGVLRQVPTTAWLWLPLHLVCGEGTRAGAASPPHCEPAAGEARGEGFAPPRRVLPSALHLGFGPGQLQPGHLAGLVPPFCLRLSLTRRQDPRAALGKP